MTIAQERRVEDRAWWDEARRGAVAGAVAFGASVITWLVAVAMLRDVDPALLFLLVVVWAVMLAIFVAAALLTARLAGSARPVATVAVGTLLAALVGRLLVVGWGLSFESAASWAWVGAGTLAGFAVGGALAAPATSRGRRSARVVTGLVALALVPLPPVIASGRDVAEREAEFASLDVPLVLVDLPGYRVTSAEVGSYVPRDLQLGLAPAGEGAWWVITVTVTRAPSGVPDCTSLASVAGEYGRAATGCRDAGPLRWVFDGPDSPAAVVVRGDAMAVLRARSSSGVDADDLAAAELRPASAEELARIG